MIFVNFLYIAISGGYKKQIKKENFMYPAFVLSINLLLRRTLVPHIEWQQLRTLFRRRFISQLNLGTLHFVTAKIPSDFHMVGLA
jgi:hypothetical protein